MRGLYNKTFLVILVGTINLFMSSCEEEEPIGLDSWGRMSKHLVTGYVFPEKMDIYCEYDSSCVMFYPKPNGLVVGHELGTMHEFEDLSEDELSRRSRMFDSMAVVYKDTSYNGIVPIGNGGYWALAYPIDSILIVSDIDYDLNHPAGVNLADVVNIQGDSFGDCVLSGYQNTKIGIGYADKRSVSDLTQANLTLFGANSHGPYTAGRFTIPQTSHPQDCQLTVTYLFSNGLKLSASAQVKL